MKFIYSKIDYINNNIILFYKTKDNKIIEKKQKYNKLIPFTQKKIYEDYFNHILSKKEYISDNTIYDELFNKKFKYDIQFTLQQ